MRLTGVLAALLYAVAVAVASPAHASPDRASLVNPFVGTALGRGNTFPGAVVPTGMVQFSPVSGHSSNPGGYRYDDHTISGFALTRLSGAGCTNMGDLPVLPLTQPFAVLPGTGLPAASFTHRQESAAPGRYHVRFDDGITTDLTATLRTGDATFRFPGAGGFLALDAGGGGSLRNGIAIELVGTTEARGWITENGFCGGPAAPTLYFDARFDKPVDGAASWGDDRQVEATVAKQQASSAAGLLLHFASPTVRMKVGLSYVDAAHASINLSHESPGWDFERIARDARAVWNRVLGTIAVSGAPPAAVRTFYTALYHALIHPTVSSDVDGAFRGRDGTVRHATGYRRLTNISGWDIYRTQVPLLALIEPRVADELVRSMVAGAAESGSMPKWEYAGVETGTMVGDPAAPIAADVIAFGDRRVDAKAALAPLRQAALQTVPGPFMYPSHMVPTDGSKFGAFVERPGLGDYISRGYIPYDLREGSIWGTASTTLEYAIADFALSRLAGAAGDRGTATAFLARSSNWRKLFNPASRYIEPRNADGSFLTGYSDSSKVGFAEGNAMQYTWSVPYDVTGLAQAIGRSIASQRLDAMLAKLNTDRLSPYAWLGNEPSFGMPWTYLWLRAPAKTQATVRRATTTLFADSPAGLPGDDDLGALSAWYVWSSLGLYPAIPGVGGVAVATPTFKTAVIRGGARTISITATGHGRYVRSVQLNGMARTRTWIDLPRSGRLELRFVRATLAQTWGSGASDAPPSFSSHR